MVIDHFKISSYSYYDYPSSADLFELPADLLPKEVLLLQKPKGEKRSCQFKIRFYSLFNRGEQVYNSQYFPFSYLFNRI